MRAWTWHAALVRWGFSLLALVTLGMRPETLGAPSAAGRATNSFIIDIWSTEDGLPQNEVTSILQTRDGYLWLGTHSGLVRFDGTGFTVFDESNLPGLRSSRIESLFEDAQANLWVGTENAGVVLVRRGEAQSLGIGPANREGRLAGAGQDPAGAVWLYLANGQLWRYDQGRTNVFLAGAEQVTDYRGLAMEPGGALWVGTDRSISAVDWRAAASNAPLRFEQAAAMAKLDLLLPSRRGGCWRLANFKVQKWRADAESPELDFGWYPWGLPRASAACEDRDGNLVVGTQGAGLFWFDASGAPTHICSTNSALSSDYILSLHADRQGDLWAGTDGGGLNRVKKPVFELFEPSRGLVVQSVAADRENGLWVGYNGSPLVYWRDGTLQPVAYVRTVFVDAQERVWAGTWGAGLLQVQNGRLTQVPEFDKSLPISAIYQDRRGWLWVGTQRGLARSDGSAWVTFTTRDGLSSDRVQALADDPAGAVWAGTEGGGLNRWQDGRWSAYRKSADELPSDNIFALHTDSQGVLWIGTDGGGLARLQEGKWTRYTRDDGLISNSIGYLLDDDQGYLWMGSNAGLMRASKKALNDFARGATTFVPCRAFGKPDGLPIRECSSGTQPGPARSTDGKLWFPTIKGLVSVDPGQLRPNTNPPPVAIQSVLIDGQPVGEDRLRSASRAHFNVPAGTEHIEVRYSSLNLTAPNRARFKYRLEGNQAGWTEAGTTTVAPYNKLGPGDYRFKVIACNEDGVWNEAGAVLDFTVLAPFWRTWWFLGSVALALLGIITGLVNYLSTQKLQRQVTLLRQQEALEKERSRIARDIHDQVGASLTQVALLGELVEGDKDAPEEVEAHARQISQTARETTRVLDEIVWAVNPANDTLDGLTTYICKYTQEYLSVADLHYRLDVPSQLPSTPLPPDVRHNVFLACKEAVTNIVRHAQATSVRVSLRLEPACFTLEIQDNGRGLAGLDPQAAQTRNGLRNMRKRMEEIGGQFAIESAAEGGAVVRFTAPLGGKAD